MFKRKSAALVLGFLLIILIFGVGKGHAASANISKSYYSDASVQSGSIVSLVPQKSGYVTPANINNSKNLFGVAVTSNESLLAIDPSSSKVQVAINGDVNVLVSNLNGDIKVGQEISVSPFDGIGMAEANTYRESGIAQTSINNTTPGSYEEQVKDKSGKMHNLNVGLVRMTIIIGSSSSTGLGGSQPNFLQKLIKDIFGKTIPTIRIILSIIVAFVALVSLVTLIYASVHGSIIAVGRNPLAKAAIFRTLSGVMIMAFITVSIATVTIYYLLK